MGVGKYHDPAMGECRIDLQVNVRLDPSTLSASSMEAMASMSSYSLCPVSLELAVGGWAVYAGPGGCGAGGGGRGRGRGAPRHISGCLGMSICLRQFRRRWSIQVRLITEPRRHDPHTLILPPPVPFIFPLNPFNILTPPPTPLFAPDPVLPNPYPLTPLYSHSTTLTPPSDVFHDSTIPSITHHVPHSFINPNHLPFLSHHHIPPHLLTPLPPLPTPTPTPTLTLSPTHLYHIDCHKGHVEL